MNFYFQFTTLNYKVRHAIAVELSKLFPCSKFAGVASSGNVSRKFLEKQTDVHYEFLIDHNEIMIKSLKEDIDFELLKEFEAILPEKSLWRIIAVDRGWGYQFAKGAYLPRTYIQTINNHENILKIATGFIKSYREIVTSFRPDVIIPAAGQNNIMCPIIEQTCRNYNILYLLPETTRTQNYMAFTDNRQCTFPQINNTTRQLIDRKIDLDLSAGEKCYSEIMADLESTKYFDVSRIDCLKTRWPWLKFLYGSLRSSIGQLIHWQKERPLRKKKTTIFKQPDEIKTLFYNIRYNCLIHYRRMQLLNSEFYSEFNPNLKYVYFPLHNTNEYSTQVQGTMWINQLQIIEALAKSIPFNWKVLVKEHPGMLLWRIRPKSFYEEIKEYSNVILIPTETSSNAVISNAQLVVTIVGTTGWEAIMRGKPVISFEENMFDALGLSRICTDFKELSVAIHDEIQRMKEVSQEERQRRIVCLLTAIMKHGFWMDDPLKVTGDAQCESDNEAREIGRVIAEAIKKYVDRKSISLRGKTVWETTKNEDY